MPRAAAMQHVCLMGDVRCRSRWHRVPFFYVALIARTSCAFEEQGSYGETCMLNSGGCHGNLYRLIFQTDSYGGVDTVDNHTYIDVVDWDKDGAQDLLIGLSDGHIQVRLQDGLGSHTFSTVSFLVSPEELGFDEGTTDTDPPITGVLPTPHGCDWNGDGLVDLIVGGATGKLKYFQRASGNQLIEPDASEDPFRGLYVPGGSSPYTVDYDQDGDPDLIIGTKDGLLLYFENVDGLLQHRSDDSGGQAGVAESPLKNVDVRSWANPTAVDFDGDDDTDVIVTSFDSSVAYWEGTASGTLLSRPGASSPFSGFPVGNYLSLRYVKFDSTESGVLVSTYFSGHLMWFRREQVLSGDASLAPREGSANPFRRLENDQQLVLSLDVSGEAETYSRISGGTSRLAVVDWDGDGLDDLVVGKHVSSSYSTISMWRRISTWDLVPLIGPEEDPFYELLVDSGGCTLRNQYASVQAVRWDGDQLLDLAVAVTHLQSESCDSVTAYSEVMFYAGEADATSPFGQRLVKQEGAANPFGVIGDTHSVEDDGYSRAAIFIVDWDDDGKLDILVGYKNGKIELYAPTGAGDALELQASDAFTYFPWSANAGNFVPAAGNWHGNAGLPDLVVGDGTGSIYLFRRAALEGVANSSDLDSMKVLLQVLDESHAAPLITDWDADGDMDLLAAHRYHGLKYFSRSWCEPVEPCNFNGICHSVKGSCTCLLGYVNVDCSECNRFFHRFPLPEDSLHCEACPGEQHGQPCDGVCCGRGECTDDNYAKANPNLTSTQVLMAIGSGNCSCSTPFYGVDTRLLAERSTCDRGVCPTGSELALLDDGSYMHCRACGPGYFKSVEANDVCTPCDLGRFMTGSGATECENCPAGQYQDTPGQTTCSNCPRGSSSAEGVSSCFSCAAGKYAPFEGHPECQTCEPGRYSDQDGQHTCANCSAGSYAETVWACRECLPGRYAPEEGLSDCTECPSPLVSTGSGASECRECPGGKRPYATKDGCAPCYPGQWSNGTECLNCDPGHRPVLSEGFRSSCEPCEPGSVNENGDLVETDSCTDCPKGKHSNEFLTECVNCVPGHYADVKGMSACIECGPGMYRDNEGGWGCSQCPAGLIAPNNASMICTGCEAGKESKAGVRCEGCSPGTYSLESSWATNEEFTGQNSAGTNRGVCTNCAAGRISSSAAGTCDECPFGKFVAEEGQSSCGNCDPGFKPAPNRYECTPCENGTRSVAGQDDCEPCFGGTQPYLDRCVDCSPGKYSYAQNDTSCEAHVPPVCGVCQNCAAGYYSIGGLSECLACSAGRVSSLGESECHSCGKGKFAPPAAGVCEPCDPGYVSEEESEFCEMCIAGTFVVDGECQNCSAGSFSTGGQGHCSPCDSGKYSKDMASECLVCPSGKFNDEEGTAACQTCIGGSPSEDAASCIPCDPGYWSTDGTCEECPKGRYQPDPGSTACIICASGSGTSVHGQSECQACEKGTYSDNGECVECPTNRTTLDPSSRDISECICLEGTQCGLSESCTKGWPCYLTLLAEDVTDNDVIAIAETCGGGQALVEKKRSLYPTTNLHLQLIQEDHMTYILCKQGPPNIPVGTFTLFGPDDNHQSTCYLGRRCEIEDGIDPQQGDMLWVLPTCGIDEGVPPGLYTGGKGDARQVGVGTDMAFILPNSASDLLAVFPGTYRMCWCRPHPTLKRCTALEDFDVQIGLFILAGPYAHRSYTCTFNEPCAIDLSDGNELGGVGLSKGDRILVRLNELCSSQNSIRLPGFGDLDGLSHPAISAGRNLSFGPLSDSLWQTYSPSSSHFTYRLCYSEERHLAGKDMNNLAPSDFVAQAGTLFLTCPPGFFTSGNGCAECLQGYFCTDGTVPMACPSSKTTVALGTIDASECVCPAGYYVFGDDACKLCEVGTYSSSSNQTECEFCPPGSTSTLEGMIAVGQCNATTSEDRGSVSVSELTGLFQVDGTSYWSNAVQSDIKGGIDAVLDGAGFQHVPDHAIQVVLEEDRRRLQELADEEVFSVRYTITLDGESTAQQVKEVLTVDAVEQWILALPNTYIISLHQEEPSEIVPAVVNCPDLKVIPDDVFIPAVELCVCDKGYQSDFNNGCEACLLRYYKDSPGDTTCTGCGPVSCSEDDRCEGLMRETLTTASVSESQCLCPSGRYGGDEMCDFCPEDMYCKVGFEPASCPPGTLGDPSTSRSDQSRCTCHPKLIDRRDPPDDDKSVSPCGCKPREYMVFKDAEGTDFQCRPCGLHCERGDSCTRRWLECEWEHHYDYWMLSMLHEAIGKLPEHTCAAAQNYGPTGYTAACTLEDGTAADLRKWVVPTIPVAYEGFYVMDRPDEELRPNMTPQELESLLSRWRSYDVRDYLLECTDDSTCLGGDLENGLFNRCAEGREGVACSDCKEGWTGGVEGPCRRCTGLGKFTFFFTSLGVMMLIIVLYQVAFSRATAVGDAVTTGILKAMRSVKQSLMNSVRYAQAMGGVTKNFAFDVPAVNMEILNLFTFVTLDVGNLIDLGCLTKMSFETLVFIRMLLPVWLAVMVFGAALLNNGVGVISHWILNQIRKLRGIEVADPVKLLGFSDGIGVYFSLFFLFFLSMLEQNLDFFICVDMPSEDYVVSSRRNVFCGFPYPTRDSRVSHSWVVLAPFVLLYVLLFTSLSCVLLLVIYRMIRKGNKTVRSHFRAQYINFRKGTYWWLLVMIVKDILFAITGVLFPGDAYAQALYSSFVMMVYMFITLLVWPFEPAYLNTQEIVLQVLASIQLLLGGLSGFGENMPGDTEKQRVRTLLGVQILGLLCIVWYLILDIMILVTALRGRAGSSLEKWEDRYFKFKRHVFGSLARTTEKSDVHIICDLVGVIVRHFMMEVGTHIDDESIRRFKKKLQETLLSLDRHEQAEWLRAATSLIAVTIVRDSGTLGSIGHHFGLLGWRNFDFSAQDEVAQDGDGSAKSLGHRRSSSTYTRSNRSSSLESLDTMEEVREIEQHGWHGRFKVVSGPHPPLDRRQTGSNANTPHSAGGRNSGPLTEDGEKQACSGRSRGGSAFTSSSEMSQSYSQVLVRECSLRERSRTSGRSLEGSGQESDTSCSPTQQDAKSALVILDLGQRDVSTSKVGGSDRDSSDSLGDRRTKAPKAVARTPGDVLWQEHLTNRTHLTEEQIPEERQEHVTNGTHLTEEQLPQERQEWLESETNLGSPTSVSRSAIRKADAPVLDEKSVLPEPAGASSHSGSANSQRGPIARLSRPTRTPLGDDQVDNGVACHGSNGSMVSTQRRYLFF